MKPLLEIPEPPENFYEDNYSLPLWYFFVFFTICVGSIALVVGAFLGLFAAASESDIDTINPFDAHIFRLVSEQTCYILLLAMGFFYLGGFIVLLDARLKIFDLFPDFRPIFRVTWVLGSILTYLYGIFRAIKNGMDTAQRATKID